MTPPEQFGPYKIVSPIGAGGMGQVFRARDERLGRDIALKILPDARDPESRRRFETEARAASALNHPNIVAVFDIGEAQGRPYIISELVEGESLRAEIQRGPIAARRLLDLAVQIADGLAAAHGAGITHRDMKPENVMVTRDGRPKILDFGLARYSAGARGDDTSKTRTEVQTAAGTILGTVAYMSPEQARGVELDARSDQFSFGVILYEMACGKRPFQGPTATDLLSSILRDEPEPLSRAAVRTPAPLRWIIERCLEKDPGRRYASTADLHQELRNLREHLAELSLSDPGVQPAPGPSRRFWTPLLLAIAASLAIGWWIGRRAAPTLEPVELTPLSAEADQAQFPAWSPDGRTLAYVAKAGGGREIFTRSLDAATPVALSRGCNCSAPFWSPDASEIYFLRGIGLSVMSSAGGEPRRVRENVFGAAISPDGKLLAMVLRHPDRATEAEIWLRDTKSGKEIVYDRAPFGRGFIFQGSYGGALQFSPDSTTLAASVWRPGQGAGGRELWILPVGEGAPKRLLGELVIPAMNSVAWMPDGRRLVVSMQKSAAEGEASLFVVDTKSGEYHPVLAGTAEQLDPSLSPDGGKLAFVSRSRYSDLVEVDLSTGADNTVLTLRGGQTAAYAPKGDQLAYSAGGGGGAGLFLRGTVENWVRPLAGAQTEGIAKDTSLRYPRISPDGSRVAFEALGGKHQIYVAAIGGGRALLLDPESPDQHEPSWSPDGAWIAYHREVPGQFTGIAKVSSSGGKPVHLVENAGSPRWSPDGAWIGFVGVAGNLLISADGKTKRELKGMRTQVWDWSRDSRQIILARRKSAAEPWEIWSHDVTSEVQKLIATTSIRSRVLSLNVAPDGKRVMLTLMREESSMWMARGFAR